MKFEPDFNAEHVLQESMGSFIPPTLLDCVCEACNGHLGRGIDLRLARDSAEAFGRVWFGGKSAKTFKSMGMNASIRFESSDAAEVTATPIPLQAPGQFALPPRPEVVFRRPGETAGLRFPANALPTPQKLVELGLSVASGELEIQILGHNYGRTFEALRRMGFNVTAAPHGSGVIPERIVSGDAVFPVTREIQRAIAKTAFNYFAFVHGPAHARDPACNDVRRFIRHDVEPHRRLFKGVPPLKVGAMNRDVNAHWLAVAAVGSEIFVEVCFFSHTCYRVLVRDAPFLLSSNYQFARTHVFDLDTKAVTEHSVVPSRMLAGFNRG